MMAFGDTRLPERFWDKVIPEPNSGCWLWLGCVQKDGYGSFRFESSARLAHRVARSAVSLIPNGLQLDHKCRVRCCVNPAHLEAVTQLENVRRGLAGVLTTHCPAGHAYDKENTYRWRNRRCCRACNRAIKARKSVAS